MDLGSLELQIFVSLTVVLGAAFVALVCDYLKGNNEQLREHNIELRVRKEEQERKLLLDPAGFLGQWLPDGNVASRPAAQSAGHGSGRTVSAHEAMQSFAAPEALVEAETRAARYQARSGKSSSGSADVPRLSQRRRGRFRVRRKETRDTPANGESYAESVRPEMIARIARKSDAAAVYGSDIRDELEATREDARPEPLNAAENWDIRDRIPGSAKRLRPPVDKVSIETPIKAEPETVAVEPRMDEEDASRLQTEIERVSQLERQPVSPAPGTILRPLTVPSLKLQEEIQRVAEQSAVSVAIAAAWHSPFLDEVIAASGTRTKPIIEVSPVAGLAALVPECEAEVSVVEAGAATVLVEEEAVEPSPFTFVMDEESAPVVVAALVVVDESVPQNEVMEAVEPPPLTFLMDEQSAPVEVASLAVVDETVFQSKVNEAVEHSPFTFFMDEESAPVGVEETVSENEVIEVGGPPRFTFAVDEEVAVAPPAVIEETMLQGEAIEAVDPPPFAFFMDEESAPVAVAPPAVIEETVLQGEAIEAVEPPPFAFFMDEESASVAVATPAVIEETVLQGEAIEAVEPPPFAFFMDEESASVAVATPAVVQETVFQSEVIEALEPPPFTFFLDEESAAVLVEEPVAPSEVIDAVEPPPFTFAMDKEAAPAAVPAPVVVDETVPQNEVIEAVEPPPFTFFLEEEPAPVVAAAPVVVEETDPQNEVIEAVEPPPFTFFMDEEPAPVPVATPAAEIEYEVAEPAPASILNNYSFDPLHSRSAGKGVSPIVDYLPALPEIEKPAYAASLTEEPALAPPAHSIPVESNLESLPRMESAPIAEEQFAVAAAIAEPPPFWGMPAASPEPPAATSLPAPIDISAARQFDQAPIAQAPIATIPDLLLPTGMHDLSTWTRLLSLPNPMTGILFVITLQPGEGAAVPERKAAAPAPDTDPAIEKLMASFVREGDFGTRIAENEWIFIYNHDVATFNQRRVGMISEKLWDFQLRHLGMANVNFKWGAIDVKSEGLAEAVQAARDHMNQTRRARKLPGADQAAARRVVNA